MDLGLCVAAAAPAAAAAVAAVDGGLPEEEEPEAPTKFAACDVDLERGGGRDESFWSSVSLSSMTSFGSKSRF